MFYVANGRSSGCGGLFNSMLGPARVPAEGDRHRVRAFSPRQSESMAARLLLITFLSVLLASCGLLESPPGKEKAIAEAYRLLQDRGFEIGHGYDNAIYLPVRFRNGRMGAFVAIGFSGPVRGYVTVFRVRDGNLELLDLRQDEVDWGIWSLVRDPRPVDAEFIRLVLDPQQGPEEIVKATGATHFGTFADEDGYFELFRITEGRINSIFKGVFADGFVGTPTGRQWEEHQYQYVDIDNDGVHEIRETISTCDLKDGADPSQKSCSNGKERIYRFNGSAFVSTR